MRNLNGFTLIELMVTLAVAVTLIAVGVPAFRSLTASNQAVAQANGLVTALNLTRGEAVKRGAPVTICRQIGANTCSTAADAVNGWADNDWAGGWVIFADANSNGSIDSGDEVVRVWGDQPGDPSIIVVDDAGTPNKVMLATFGSLGERTTNGSQKVIYTITNPDCKGNQVRVVTLSATGQVTTTKSACP